MKKKRESKKRLPKWKRQEESRTRERKRKIFRSVKKVTVVIVLVAVGLVVVLSLIKSRFNGKDRFTFLLSTPSLWLATFDPTSETAALVRVPDEMMIEVGYGYGNYRAGALAGLDNQERMKGRLVSASVAQEMGVFVDGYVVGDFFREDIILSRREEVLGFFAEMVMARLSGRVKSNLTVVDLMRLWFGMARVRPNKFELVDLELSDALRESYLPDGSMVLEVDESRLTLFAERWFINEQLVKEGVEVLIVNTTGVGGLGRRLARQMSTTGFRVVAVENSDSPSEVSEIKYNDEKLRNSMTIKGLARWLGVAAMHDQSIGDDRVGVVVFLGRDIEERLIGRD